MRGKRKPPKSGTGGIGITPADAGKTSGTSSVEPDYTDHPRGCGENPPEGSFLRMRLGSPPRMRGKLKYDFTQSKAIGITPADAGKTRGHGCIPASD